MQDKWLHDALLRLPCSFLQASLRLSKWQNKDGFPTCEQLTHEFKKRHAELDYEFIEQNENVSLGDYYENIISIRHQIPTRKNNWHDFLNAIIWFQFPKTKALISDLHRSDIENIGLNRTPRRDRLTHFDECGCLLLIQSRHIEQANEIIHDLATHQWNKVFVTRRASWFNIVTPCIFGHGSLEMLMHPFIGLTAKWLAIIVDDDFMSRSTSQQLDHIDDKTCSTLKLFNGFYEKNILRPLPLLGIPTWHREQDQQFYKNRDYFRSQRNHIPMTLQYPLKR